MFTKLAYRQIEREKKLNWLVMFQQIIVFILCICCVSVWLSETKYFSAFWKYLKQKGVYIQCDGIVDGHNMKMVQDSSWLEKRMNKAHAVCCYSVVGDVENKKNGEVFQMEGRAYDEELINAYEPCMREGKWLNKHQKESDKIHVVISENTIGLKTGDIIYIYGDEIENPIEAVISGVLKNQEQIIGYSCTGETDNDYRMFYESRDIETEEKPIILMEYKELKSYIEKYHNSAKPIIDNSVIFIYDKDITNVEAEENNRFLTEQCEANIIQNLSVIKKNSGSYLWGKLSVVFPIFVCAVILTMLTQITTAIIIGKRNLRCFMIYRFCGASQKKLSKIILLQSLGTTGVAAIAAYFIIYIILQVSREIDTTMLKMGIGQFAVCTVVAIVQILVNYCIQVSIIRKGTIIQGLNKTSDSEG